MARAGDVIENPVSGETIVFLRTGADTDGELLQLDLFVRPGGATGAEHIHPLQEERFTVRRGRMTLRADGLETVLEAGDEAVVPAGIRHSWWNSGDEELNAMVEFRPAGRYAGFVTSFFGLAKADQVDDRGMPGILQMSVILDEYRDTVRLASPAGPIQKVLFGALAPIGRMLGVRPDYPYPRSARSNAGMEIWRPEHEVGREPMMVGR
jgi:quercetin dioxygenase-like cupin family protein